MADDEHRTAARRQYVSGTIHRELLLSSHKADSKKGADQCSISSRVPSSPQ